MCYYIVLNPLVLYFTQLIQFDVSLHCIGLFIHFNILISIIKVTIINIKFHIYI